MRGFTLLLRVSCLLNFSQNVILRKYGLEPHLDDFRSIIDRVRRRASNYLGVGKRESKENTLSYYKQIFGLFPEKLRPEFREGFMGYDDTNNFFNLAYEILAWKIHKALIRAKLEPYLGSVYGNILMFFDVDPQVIVNEPSELTGESCMRIVNSSPGAMRLLLTLQIFTITWTSEGCTRINGILDIHGGEIAHMYRFHNSCWS